MVAPASPIADVYKRQGYNLASPQYLASKGYKFLNTNGDWYYILGQKPEDGGGFLKKAIENTEKTPFNQLASTKYPEVDLPTVGSMVAIWADRPSAEYKEEEIFEMCIRDSHCIITMTS